MFHSAALKLTLWYLGIIMAISLVFSVAIYRVSSDDLGRNARRQIGYFNNFLPPGDFNNYSNLRQQQLNEDYNHLKSNLVAFNALVLAAGGWASYMLARRTLRPIETALQSQSRFASDASHELRTPLAAMQAENEVALRNPALTKKDAIELLKSNLEEVGKLRMLSEGLLRLAKGSGRIDSGEAVPLRDIAGQAVSRLAKAAEAKKIKLAIRVNKVSARGDRDSLSELAAIFIDNAIKYSRAGSTVRISGGLYEKSVYLSVADKGQGIGVDELPRIFERFYRTDGSRHRDSGGGYGLGLAIAKQIAAAHGGHIGVKSIPGRGSTFTVYLPPA